MSLLWSPVVRLAWWETAALGIQSGGESARSLLPSLSPCSQGVTSDSSPLAHPTAAGPEYRDTGKSWRKDQPSIPTLELYGSRMGSCCFGTTEEWTLSFRSLLKASLGHGSDQGWRMLSEVALELSAYSFLISPVLTISWHIKFHRAVSHLYFSSPGQTELPLQTPSEQTIASSD